MDVFLDEIDAGSYLIGMDEITKLTVFRNKHELSFGVRADYSFLHPF